MFNLLSHLALITGNISIAAMIFHKRQRSAPVSGMRFCCFYQNVHGGLSDSFLQFCNINLGVMYQSSNHCTKANIRLHQSLRSLRLWSDSDKTDCAADGLYVVMFWLITTLNTQLSQMNSLQLAQGPNHNTFAMTELGL